MTGEKKITKQEQEPATDEITEIAPGVLRTQLPVELPGLGHVNCYLLEDERGVAVVDPGLPGLTSWNALLDRLARAGFALRHVHTAVVTHSHFDHFGGAPQLRAEAGTEILTHDSFREHFDERELFEDHDSAVLELNPADELDRIRELMRRPKPWWPLVTAERRRPARLSQDGSPITPLPGTRSVDHHRRQPGRHACPT